MARILAYTSPARGHLFPLTPVLDELKARGHEIALRTLAAEVDTMRDRGFEAQPISERVEAVAMDDWRAGGNPRKALQRAVTTFGARARHDAPDIQLALEREQPDALLVDINCWGALAAAESWGGPWAAFCPYPLPLASRDAPPFGPGLKPAGGAPGRVRDKLLRPLVTGTLEKQMLPPYNEVRERLGLAPLRSADEIFLAPPLLIYMTAEPFEYPRGDWPDSVVLVGPCEWEPASELPGWASGERPLVLVTTSSEFQDDGKLARAAAEALAHEPYDVVITMPAGDPRAFEVPANVRVERFVPHGPLLDRAVCAVTHGGMGATQKALARGVPVCAVPFGRDQLEVARRVAVAGAGTRLPARRLSPDRLRRHVRDAIGLRPGAQRVAAAFAAAGGASAAADAFAGRVLSS